MNMDEISFGMQTDQIAQMSRRFPAHRTTQPVAHPQGDLAWLATGPEFGRHAWDEGGHL